MLAAVWFADSHDWYHHLEHSSTAILFFNPYQETFAMAQTGLGAALRKLRERRTLSLREISQLSTVDHAYVHRLETGEKTSPSGELLSKLLKVLKPTEREADIVKWLASHPEADPDLVEYVLDDESVDIVLFTVAAGARHRGNARPDPATLIARIRRAFDDEDE